MSNRDIWTKAGTTEIRDLLTSLLASLLLHEQREEPLYLSSPFLTEFEVFDNSFFQFQSLFREYPQFGEQSNIMLSQVLFEISTRMPVRLIAVDNENATPFLHKTIRKDYPNIFGRLATDIHHEKGLLCPTFYVEGSMNITYSGVYRNREKITVSSPDSSLGKKKIAAATLEFDRLWETLTGSDFERVE